MIRLLVDQNFNEHILNGLVQRAQDLDWVFARDVGLSKAPDPTLLEWAAAQDRILLTHDRQTIPRFSYERVAAGLPMPGVFLVSDQMPVGQAIYEILLVLHCLSAQECKDIVKFFPL